MLEKQKQTRKQKYLKQRILIDIENLRAELEGKELKNTNQSYIETLDIAGKDIDVWLDDYGQCYVLKWVDDNGETQEESCGTYNTDYAEYAKMKFDTEYKYNQYRKLGIILASDREYMCQQIAKLLASREIPDRIYDKYLYGMPFNARSEEDIFKMIYGTWCK